MVGVGFLGKVKAGGERQKWVSYCTYLNKFLNTNLDEMIVETWVFEQKLK